LIGSIDDPKADELGAAWFKTSRFRVTVASGDEKGAQSSGRASQPGAMLTAALHGHAQADWRKRC
jgi:hypothetical protein